MGRRLKTFDFADELAGGLRGGSERTAGIIDTDREDIRPSMTTSTVWMRVAPRACIR